MERVQGLEMVRRFVLPHLCFTLGIAVDPARCAPCVTIDICYHVYPIWWQDIPDASKCAMLEKMEKDTLMSAAHP